MENTRKGTYHFCNSLRQYRCDFGYDRISSQNTKAKVLCRSTHNHSFADSFDGIIFLYNALKMGQSFQDCPIIILLVDRVFFYVFINYFGGCADEFYTRAHLVIFFCTLFGCGFACYLQAFEKLSANDRAVLLFELVCKLLNTFVMLRFFVKGKVFTCAVQQTCYHKHSRAGTAYLTHSAHAAAKA